MPAQFEEAPLEPPDECPPHFHAETTGVLGIKALELLLLLEHRPHVGDAAITLALGIKALEDCVQFPAGRHLANVAISSESWNCVGA